MKSVSTPFQSPACSASSTAGKFHHSMRPLGRTARQPPCLHELGCREALPAAASCAGAARRDGDGPLQPLEHPSAFRKLAAAMWRAPNDPHVFGSVDVDMGAAEAFLSGYNARNGARPPLPTS